ncbi:ATP-binding cassette domain-containing protein [Shinella sp. CPCC 101442]|uniref:ATP-binding cassette domain-containing protein n=1 Tax=Shinella sp. CPCC 101442 TaxID=2932265 RepID=UPI002152635B|nr:ATP-binding cassette domain-containing protein [Shinella sp. CPCC 101442]MCR6500467.1 ATP-binding cassette domain-containing protein [Shinella sp. CPCC 101442]
MRLEAVAVGFGFGGGTPVLDGVDLALESGRISGLTGKSGRGKSTLGKILARHLLPTKGRVLIDGAAPVSSGFNPVQLIHQTAIFAVNPRWKIGRIVSEACLPDEALMQALGIRRQWLDRYPHELSGGELQRVALLRSLTPRTRFLIADEITSMLDPIAQSEIWHALIDVSEKRDIGILVISHDRALLDRVAAQTVTL